VLRRSERADTLSSASDDEVGGIQARSAASGSEQFNTGSRGAVLRRSELTGFSSASDDEVGGIQARSAASGSEQFNTGCRPADYRTGRLRHAESKIATAAAAISPVPKIKSPS
jgi:hypothetical protein